MGMALMEVMEAILTLPQIADIYLFVALL